MVVDVVKYGRAEVEEGGYYCYYHYSDGPAGCVYMMYADESGEVRPTEAAGRLLTSSTTKLSSLLSASLPCERREREGEIGYSCSAV